MDDDERFIYEDQINSQEGDQPLRRLEDIVGEIKKDLIKANSGAVGNLNSNINIGLGNSNYQN